MKPSIDQDHRRELTSPAAPASPWRAPLIIVLLLATTVTAYWGVGRCGFVNLDDDAYVETNPLVNQGVRPAAVVWAGTAAHSSMWHPLTTLSHILDCELFGVQPAPMHWENLLWHALNAVLVFLVWRALTGTTWRSALVAAFFALHPLSVESVAWISERKNLLCTFFWLLGLGAYVRYVRAPSVARYAVLFICFTLGLLCKPMIVTFPCTLLLLDFWPLHRWPDRSWRPLFGEKIPLFALGAGLSVVTFLAQDSGGAVDYGRRFSVVMRLSNAVVSYVRYLAKAAWPESLSAFYAHPGLWPASRTAGACALLIGVSWLVWRQRTAHRWLAFGWLWFLGTLVPVIGLVQSGAQAMADRYGYVPLLGVFTILIWAGAEIAARRPPLRLPLVLVSLLALGACFVLTQRQVRAWENSTRLYEHSIAVGEDNGTVRYLLAVALHSAGRPEADVAAQFRRALELQPDYVNAYSQLSILALRHQRFDEAWSLVETTLRLEPRNPTVHRNAAAVELWRQRLPAAIGHLQDAVRLNPAYVDGHHDLARIYVSQNRLEEARGELETVLRLTPWDWAACGELGVLLANLNQPAAARDRLERSLWINPAYEPARRDLAALSQLQQSKR
ncbi:MAG: tetratricopeptide repeat protein [Opitutus sp.]|nr:tetratricopeptide repeat protein [Opitutus sp.]